MMRIFIGVAFLILFTGLAKAEVECAEPLSTYQKVISCAESRSPDVQAAELSVARAKAQIGAAGQWRNPEFAVETFQGKSGDADQGETDISIGIPIELGGKISARKDIAQSGVVAAEAELLQARAKVRKQVLLNLHRLRQVLHEQELTDEAIGTFSKLVSQYARRPSLSPEQQISASVFQLSKSDYDLKRSATTDEIYRLDSFFRLTVGLTVEQAKKALPPSPKVWPEINFPQAAHPSIVQKILQAEVDTANAELSLSRGDAWPTLMVGPSMKRQTEGGQTNDLFGINLSLPIPVFSLNGGAKAVAAENVRLSELRKKNGLREQDLKKEELIRIYEVSVKALNGSLTHQEIEKRHSDADKLFTRGVVPSSLVIEAHRTSFELEKTRHERELRALEALLDLYAIQGTILEVNL